MRSFTIVLLFALALAIAAFAPVASADANITLYADAACTQQLGEGAQDIPLPSSPTCQDLSGVGGSGSAIFFCNNVGGYNNMSLAIWATSSSCSGTADASITGYGKEGSCVPITISAGGQSGTAFATLECSSSVALQALRKHAPVNVDALVESLTVSQRAAFMANNMGGRKGKLARLLPKMHA